VVLVTIGLVCVFQFLYGIARTLLPAQSETRRLVACLTATLVLWSSTTVGYNTFASTSHVAGFMAVALLIRMWWHVRDSDRPRDWALLGLCGGLAMLSRWQNALMLALPFLYDVLRWRSWASVKAIFEFGWLRNRLLFAGIAIACLVPQFLQWHAIYGRYVTNPHGEDAIDLPPRFFLNVLFSSRHGWFTWTPITVLCVIGLLYGCLRAYRVFVPVMIVLILEVALLGSMPRMWHASEAFGMRTLTCSLSIAAMGLGWLALHVSRRRTAVSLGIVAASCILYTLLFAAQYRLDLLPRQDWLTSEELVADKIFLKRAHERQQQVRLASNLLRKGRSDRAVEVLEGAERRYGDSRFLLQALSEAYAAMGERQKADQARQRLQALLDRRLY
jgi:hypothetical protein